VGEDESQAKGSTSIPLLTSKIVMLRVHYLFQGSMRVDEHKREYPKPSQNEPSHSLPFKQTLNKGSSNSPPPIPSTPLKIQTPQINFPPQIKPKPIPKNIPRCFKCQDSGHTSADCTNRIVITFAQWESFQEEKWRNP